MGLISVMLLLPIILVIFIVSGIVKAKDEREGENMFKQLYIYLVLFTTLIMTIGGGVGVFMGAADLVSPNTYLETYRDYKNNVTIEFDENGNEIKSNKPINEEQIKKDYNEMVKDEEARVKKEAKNTIIKSFGFIVIPFPVFLYFNTRLRKNVE